MKEMKNNKSIFILDTEDQDNYEGKSNLQITIMNLKNSLMKLII